MIRDALGDPLTAPVAAPGSFTPAPAFMFTRCPHCGEPQDKCEERARAALEKKLKEGK